MRDIRLSIRYSEDLLSKQSWNSVLFSYLNYGSPTGYRGTHIEVKPAIVHIRIWVCRRWESKGSIDTYCTGELAFERGGATREVNDGVGDCLISSYQCVFQVDD